MEQRLINTDAFAHLTFQDMLLRQLSIAFFMSMPDRGAQFTEKFMTQLRYKLNIPTGAATDSGVDAQQLQEIALQHAERFFASVRKAAQK